MNKQATRDVLNEVLSDHEEQLSVSAFEDIVDRIAGVIDCRITKGIDEAARLANEIANELAPAAAQPRPEVAKWITDLRAEAEKSAMKTSFGLTRNEVLVLTGSRLAPLVAHTVPADGIPSDYQPRPASAPVGAEELPPDVQEMIREDKAGWALAKLAESHGAVREEDDNDLWWTLRIDQFKALAQQPAAVDGVDWKAMYRIQTAMRYMDNMPDITRDAAFRMADQDCAGLEAQPQGEG